MKLHRIVSATQKRPTPIDCSDHDYIEIACLYNYDLIVELRNGETLDFKAINTVTRNNESCVPVEYLVGKSTKRSFNVALNEILKIRVLNKVARFRNVSFTSNI